MPSQKARETFAIEAYGTLLSMRENWAGTLVLCSGDVNLYAGIPAAVCVAGGTCLSIGAEPSWIKSAQNDGILDFVVNDLSEALRTLKNAVRVQRSLSVAIASDPQPILSELVERGVLPDCIVPNDSPAKIGPLLCSLLDQGSLLYRPDFVDSKRRFREWLASNHWVECAAPEDNAVPLKIWNERLLDVLPNDDEIRRRWIRKAPLYFKPVRSGVRSLWLSHEEQERLAAIES